MSTETIQNEIKRRVDRVLIEEFEVDPEAIKPDAAIIGNLGLDSLDIVDLVICIEKEFDARMEDEHVRAMSTIGDVYAYIETHWQEHVM